MKFSEIFSALRSEGLPLFLSFAAAVPVLGVPSEKALRQAWRRGSCPVRVSRNATGQLGFSLVDISEFCATGIPQTQPILLCVRDAVPKQKKRGAPTKAERIAKLAAQVPK